MSKACMALIILLSGCASIDSVKSADARISILEMEIKLLKERPCPCPAPLPIPDPDDDKK